MLQHADDAGAGEPGVHVEPHGAELVGDERGGRRFLERGLRMRVQVAAPAAELGLQRGDFGDDVHRGPFRPLGKGIVTHRGSVQ